MAYPTHVLPSLEDARKKLHDYELGAWQDDVLVSTGDYVFVEEDITAWLSLLANGYKFDFTESYVRVIPC